MVLVTNRDREDTKKGPGGRAKDCVRLCYNYGVKERYSALSSESGLNVWRRMI